MDACAGPLLRYRRAIGADDISVYCDIKKNHSAHSVTADVDIAETAEAAGFFLADGVVITGSATGKEACLLDLDNVMDAVSATLPVLVGSGVTAENVSRFSRAHGLIVGSYFKRKGTWDDELDEAKIEKLVQTLETVRQI